MALAVAALVWQAGCADGEQELSTLVPLTIENQSQFELLEVWVHSGASPSGPNLAEQGLAVGSTLHVAEFESGSYVTVVRQRVEVGDVIAVTTADPVEVWVAGAVLVVFDTSFRLVEPTVVESLP